MRENKKMYSFRFSRKTNNQLTNLASQYRKDRTELLEYMIDVWASMYNDDGSKICENDTTQ